MNSLGGDSRRSQQQRQGGSIIRLRIRKGNNSFIRPKYFGPRPIEVCSSEAWEERCGDRPTGQRNRKCRSIAKSASALSREVAYEPLGKSRRIGHEDFWAFAHH